MGYFLFFLGAIVVGVIVGFLIFYVKRDVRPKIEKEMTDRYNQVDARYHKMSKDMGIIDELGDKVQEKYKNAVPEKISRARGLLKRFENGWFGDRQGASPVATRVMYLTTYEMEKILSELEELMTEIFS